MIRHPNKSRKGPCSLSVRARSPGHANDADQTSSSPREMVTA